MLTYKKTGGNINKLSLMRLTKFEKICVEMSILSYRRRQKMFRKKSKKVVDKAKRICYYNLAVAKTTTKQIQVAKQLAQLRAKRGDDWTLITEQ